MKIIHKALIELTRRVELFKNDLRVLGSSNYQIKKIGITSYGKVGSVTMGHEDLKMTKSYFLLYQSPKLKFF